VARGAHAPRAELRSAAREDSGGRMQVEFTTNALARMADRTIPEAGVRAAIEAPDHLGPCLEKCWHARKKIEGRTLEVLFTRDLAHTRILTAYWQDPSS
jgi:hypothetical protein